MLNVPAHALPNASELAGLVSEHLDSLCTYATHLVGDAEAALEFTAAGLYHARRYPPARITRDGRAALYRAVTNACRHEQRLVHRRSGLARFFGKARTSVSPAADADAAERINTVKRSLMTVGFERRAALLLRDLAHLGYREIGQALECSPEQAARLLAGARRQFGSIYREIAL